MHQKSFEKIFLFRSMHFRHSLKWYFEQWEARDSSQSNSSETCLSVTILFFWKEPLGKKRQPVSTTNVWNVAAAVSSFPFSHECERYYPLMLSLPVSFASPRSEGPSLHRLLLHTADRSTHATCHPFSLLSSTDGGEEAQGQV